MRTQTLKGMLIAVTVSALAVNSFGGTIIKADNADALNLASSWVGGVAPGTNDVATWNAALTAGRTYALGADLSWLGLAFTADPGGNVTFSSGATLTIGAEGIYSVPNRTMTFNNAFTLDTDQTWLASSGTFIPAGPVATEGYTLTLAGGATKQFKGAITGGGALILARGGTRLSNGSTATDSHIYANNGSSLTFDATPAAGGAARATNVTLRGAGNDSARVTLRSDGVNSANTLDIISGALTIDAGHAYVTAAPNSARPLVLNAGTFSRNQGSTVLFRGSDLGLSTIASGTAGDANVSFTTAPALIGGAGAADSTTVSILHGAYGDITTTGNGTALVTYDATYGVRLLSTTTEFTNTITSGQTQLDNVRYVNTSGAGIITTTLTEDTRINSLSFEETGTGTDTGIRIIGDVPERQLTLHSGMIFARQTVTTAHSTDAMIISNLTLNLNGQEGVFVCQANGLNQGNTPGALFIYAAITNDGGNGVTVGTIGGGNGEVYFAGPATNTYTGPTILNSGYLRLFKTPANTGIPGDLIINGGALLKSSESVPDTADITLNGGSFYFDSTTSSGNNSHSETIRNLYMYGGTINYNSGNNHVFNINGDAIINANDLRLNSGGDITVLGTTFLNGGRISVSLSSSTSVNNAFFSFNDIVITNLAKDAYSPIVLRSHATSIGGQLTLNGTLTFVGNSQNNNTALVDFENSALAQQGFIALNGTRTFNIGDGAAETDLAVNPKIADDGATVGGLVKTGAGTLALNGANTYTGGTSVNEGSLAGTGSLASDISIAAGAALAPGTAGTVGTFTVTGNVSFAAASIYRADIDGDTADLLAVSGEVSGGLVTVEVSSIPSDSVRLMTATEGITASFVSSQPDLALVKMANNTELWIRKSKGTVIRIF